MMASEIIGCKKTLVIMQYGSRFREIRKCTNRSMGTRACVEKFVSLLEKETVKLLVGVTADPGFWLSIFGSELSSATAHGLLISTPRRLRGHSVEGEYR